MSTLLVNLPQTPNLSSASPSIPSSLPSIPNSPPTSLPQTPSLPSFLPQMPSLGGISESSPLSSIEGLSGNVGDLTNTLPVSAPEMPLDPSTLTSAATEAGLDTLTNLPGMSQTDQLTSLIKRIMGDIVGSGKGGTSLGASSFKLTNPFSFFKDVKPPDPKTPMSDKLFNADKLKASTQASLSNAGSNLSSTAGNLVEPSQSTGQNLAGQASSIIENIV